METKTKIPQTVKQRVYDESLKLAAEHRISVYVAAKCLFRGVAFGLAEARELLREMDELT